MKDSTIWYLLALNLAVLLGCCIAPIIAEPLMIVVFGIPAFGIGWFIYVCLVMHFGILEEEKKGER